MSDQSLQRPAVRSSWTDAATLAGRCVRLSRRNTEALLTSLMLPVMLLLMFVYLFGGALQTGSGGYVRYVVPGVLMLCAGFGSSLTAVSVSLDMSGGIVDRFRSMDVSGVAWVAGHVVASTARNLASTLVVFTVAFAIGFRPHASALEWLAAIGLVVLFIISVSWLAATIGLLAGSPEAANGFTFFVMFAPYASSAFVPIGTMPSWIRGFARHQPCTPTIESIRNLLLGTPAGSNPWIALAWCLGLLAVSIAGSSWLVSHRTR